jgi:hypothetical protein
MQKYRNKIDGSVIEVYTDKRKVTWAKFIESKTKNHLDKFMLTENWNKFKIFEIIMN